MTATIDTTAPINVAVRQMSMKHFDLRPASNIELLGIAIATCLLAFFLSVMLCTGIRISWGSVSPAPDAGDIPNTSIPGKGSKTARSIRKWSTVSLSRLRTRYYDDLHDCPQTPYFASLGYNKRMRLSRKPLLMVVPTITSVERKDAVFDLEEGLGLKSASYSAVSNGYGDSLRPGEVVCRGLKPKKNGDHSGGSFLHYRTASLQ
ncbi:hypothetical protein F4861DRAFT_228234 [Xylaria intraflava]|nr:hypothetical protein F4861DRAFT_228234 [Xylaria intraflava]